MRQALIFSLCSWLLFSVAAPQSWAQPASESANFSQLQTVAEATKYEATARGADVELFLKRLQRLWQGTQLESLGKTVEGRDIWGLIVPPKVAGPNTITVLMLGGIHSGECDGKEALLALARDYASGKQAKLPEHVRMIFVPNFNADGNERVGKLHRPGQDGPAAGMGIRENAQGLDLNRDFVKLETPEVQTLVRALDRFNVDIMIDTHTTNGSLHRYDLTYAISNNPAAPRALDNWLREKLLPTLDSEMAKVGIQSFYYGNFEDGHKSWKSFGHEPRYSTELMGLRGKIGILSESYSYATYERRIQATYEFVRAILNQADANSAWLRTTIDVAAASSGQARS